jgi:uncharacterized membrane protein YhaH (DUF805 family)
MEWYTMVWQKYAQFTGRSRRKEYWMFVLINLLVFALLYVGALVLMTQSTTIGVLLMIGCLIYALAGLIPHLAVTIRRLHDTNKSGWWILISLVPLVGGIILLVFLATEGDAADNQFGSNPKLLPPVAPLLTTPLQ